MRAQKWNVRSQQASASFLFVSFTLSGVYQPFLSLLIHSAGRSSPFLFLPVVDGRVENIPSS